VFQIQIHIGILFIQIAVRGRDISEGKGIGNAKTRSAEKAGFSFMNYPKELIVKMKEALCWPLPIVVEVFSCEHILRDMSSNIYPNIEERGWGIVILTNMT
jgi:hypothetical protein